MVKFGDYMYQVDIKSVVAERSNHIRHEAARILARNLFPKMEHESIPPLFEV